MIFKTSLGVTAWIVTLAVTTLFACLIIAQYIFVGDNKTAMSLTSIVCIAVYIIAFAFHPISYKITENELIICRPFYNARISRTEIKSSEIIGSKDIGSSIRTFGIGGLFGFTGKFADFSIGQMTWYVTRKDKPVLVTTVDDKKFVFSPNEQEGFVAALKQTG